MKSFMLGFIPSLLLFGYVFGILSTMLRLAWSLCFLLSIPISVFYLGGWVWNQLMEKQ